MAGDSARLLLLVDEEPAQARLVAVIAARAGWRLLRAADAAQALEVIARQPIDAAIVDHWGSPEEGAAIVAALRSAAPAVPVVMLTARASTGHAVAAMRAGAADFLVKPIAPDRLLAALDAAARPASGGELRPLTEKPGISLAFDEIVGSAPAFRAALAVAAKAARARVPVLIEGERGVGKELIAHAIHAASPRARKPLVVVNCGTLPANLIESELFGHERGAFPGAFERSLGRMVEADGGTLVLDGPGGLPPDAQVKLLHAIQTGEVQPLGGRGGRHVDVRIIATSDRPLIEQVGLGGLREDLYYRLAVVQLTIPALRLRGGDIPALARHLLARIADHPGLRPLGITDGALALLMRYEWPGNVRQLQDALFRAAVLCEGDALTEADFPRIAEEAAMPLRIARPPPGGGGITLYEPSGHLRSLDAIEADVIRLAIGHYRGRMTEVARRLGIGRSTLYRKLSDLGIDSAA